MEIKNSRKIKIFSFFALILFFPALVFAHGGVSKNVGNYVVYLNQSPISPLVGENVKMDFSIRDFKNQPLTGAKISLTLTDTYYGDESRDKVILNQDVTTDNNGDFEFAYSFDKENYFDLDLDFKDSKTGEDDSTGFLIQPRNAFEVSTQRQQPSQGYYAIAAAAAGLLLGLAISYKFKAWKNKA